MGVTGLDHVNISARDLAASVDFYTRLLGFSDEPPPGAASAPARLRWLYDGEGRPILHFQVREPGASALDHVALRCTGKAGMVARLEADGIAFRTIEGTLPGMTQLFLTDPSGLRLELVFRNE